MIARANAAKDTGKPAMVLSRMISRSNSAKALHAIRTDMPSAIRLTAP